MIDHEEEGKKQDGISRRQFLKFCGVVAGALGWTRLSGRRFRSLCRRSQAIGAVAPFCRVHRVHRGVAANLKPRFADLIFDTILSTITKPSWPQPGYRGTNPYFHRRAEQGAVLLRSGRSHPMAAGVHMGGSAAGRCSASPRRSAPGQGDHRHRQLRLLRRTAAAAPNPTVRRASKMRSAQG